MRIRESRYRWSQLRAKISSSLQSRTYRKNLKNRQVISLHYLNLRRFMNLFSISSIDRLRFLSCFKNFINIKHHMQSPCYMKIHSPVFKLFNTSTLFNFKSFNDDKKKKEFSVQVSFLAAMISKSL